MKRMKMEDESTYDKVPDHLWQAIIKNDESYNYRFYYGVKTTRIFCRPACKSRVPKRENVQVFQNVKQALEAKYRPCKRCNPTGDRLPNHEWISHITEYIDKNYMKKLNLNVLANVSHRSPYHLHRMFKKEMGITPVEYIQQIRIKSAEHFILSSDKSIADISREVGVSNTPYFITLFKKKTGVTPTEFRNRQKKV